MTKPVLFIHGAGEGAHAADSKLAASLRKALGADYQVVDPQMPNEDSPDYDAWKNQITGDLAALEGKVILAGHSFGGSVILKYLAENPSADRIAAVISIAAPYFGAKDWEVDEYALPDDFAARLPPVPVLLYHARDDEGVPFAHLALYAAKIPQATVREVESGGHQFNDDLSIVAADTINLMS